MDDGTGGGLDLLDAGGPAARLQYAAHFGDDLFGFLRKEFDPRKWLAASTKAMKEICKARHQAFGTSGQASRIRPLGLEAMVKRYDKGELDPRVG